MLRQVFALRFQYILGAKWNNDWRDSSGRSLLHVLAAAFPGDDNASNASSSTISADGRHSRRNEVAFSSYQFVMRAAIANGADVSSHDTQGRSVIFTLCERMAQVSQDTCPPNYAIEILEMLLHSSTYTGLGGANRSGQTLFDIVDKVSKSCLMSCQHLLLQNVHYDSDYNE
jgi:hypothetical protein